ncbi:MAG TPA: hypothetical protein VN088_20070, partial [Nocardioides sp.]|nr:hypothetical protein [Nocardioides sp.]
GHAPVPPPRRTPWGWIIGGTTALVLVIALGIGGWAFATGRLGFGPLSAQDKAAAAAIADGVNSPSWADDGQRSCAATKLLHERRSKALAASGLITKDGDGWTFTGSWQPADAQRYAEDLLACSDDWKKQVGDQWKVSDTGCLDKVGRSQVAAVLVTSELRVDDADARKAHDSAADALDQCYGTGVAKPTGTATPAYRAVSFRFDLPDAANAQTTLTVDGPDGQQTVSGSTYQADAEEGGAKVCIKATLSATYGWGSTVTSTTRVCGHAKPKRLWWAKLPHCSEYAGCVVWALYPAGFRTGVESLTFNGSGGPGDCPFVSGNCSHSVLIGSDGRGLDDAYVFRLTTGPGKRTDVTAHMGGLTARLP